MASLNNSILDDVLDNSGNDLKHLEEMVHNVCVMYPHLDPNYVGEKLIQRASTRIEDLIKFSSKRRTKKITSEDVTRIAEEDLADARLMGDKKSMIDYLLEIYPDLTYKEVKSELTRNSSKKGSSKRRTKKITGADVNEAIHFNSYQFDGELKEKIIKFMIEKYPTLTRHEIIDQLSGYDFDNKIARGSPSSWSLTKTPPRRGKTYLPVDFSPSTYGAASTAAMDFYKSKRSKYLPHYVSPPSTPMASPGLSTPRRRFPEDRTPPSPSPSPRTRAPSGRRLSFD